MVCMFEFQQSIGAYKWTDVALFDNEKMSEEEAVKCVREGKQEVGDKFLVVSSSSYAFLQKAVKETVERNDKNDS